MYMDYVNRATLTDNTRQVLSSFDWDIDIDFPSTYAPYHPDINLIKQRLLSVEGLQGVPNGTTLDYRLRGFTFIQPGLTEMEPQDITLRFQDFEDQSIHIWMLDWRSKVNSWRNRFSYRKEDVYLNMDFYQLNSSRQPVGKWECRTGIINGNDIEATGQNEKNALGENSLVIRFEYVEFIPLNV